ncbi:MAG: rhodanese-like domain-containing protein [Pseudomonadota bacterium]
MNAAVPAPAPAGPAFRHDLARWRQLVAPAWLHACLAGRAVMAAPSANWRLFEVGCDGSPAFAQAHIPGATYLDTQQLEQQPLWNKVSDRALLDVLLANGVRHDSTVVLYGRNPLAAARAAHLMLYAGVADVRLLDGGWRAWCAAGYGSEAGTSARHAPIDAFGIDFPARPEYLIDMRQARELLRRRDAALVSTRSWNEFIGKTSGYSYIDAKGDIPGARWGRAGNDDDVNSMLDYHHADGTLRDAADIRRLWTRAGIRRGQRTAFYCGTGWRASLAFYFAWLMEWDGISVYDGGWFEWSLDPRNPVVCRAGQDGSAA